MQLVASQEAASETHELSQVVVQHDDRPSRTHTRSERFSAEESQPGESAAPVVHGE